MKVTKITFCRRHLREPGCEHAVINNKTSPTSEMIITNLCLALLEMCQYSKREESEHEKN